MFIYPPDTYEDSLGNGSIQSQPYEIDSDQISRNNTNTTITQNRRESIPTTHMNWIYYLSKKQHKEKLHEKGLDTQAPVMLCVKLIQQIKNSKNYSIVNNIVGVRLRPPTRQKYLLTHHFTTKQLQRNNETTPDTLRN